MMASSLANYVVLAAAGAITAASGETGPERVVLLNMAITAASVLLALVIRRGRAK